MSHDEAVEVGGPVNQWWRVPTDYPGLTKKQLCEQWLHRVLPTGHGRGGMNRGVAGKELITATNVVLAQEWALAELADAGFSSGDLKLARVGGAITEAGALTAAAYMIENYAWQLAQASIDVGRTTLASLGIGIPANVKDTAVRFARTALIADGVVADPQQLARLHELYPQGSAARDELVGKVAQRLRADPVVQSLMANPAAQASRRATQEQQAALLTSPRGQTVLKRIAGAAAPLLRWREAEDVLSFAALEASQYLLRTRSPSVLLESAYLTKLLRRIMVRRLHDLNSSNITRGEREQEWAEEQVTSAQGRSLHQEHPLHLRAEIAIAITELTSDPSREAVLARHWLGQIDPESPDIDLTKWLENQWGASSGTAHDQALPAIIEKINAAFNRARRRDGPS